MRRKFVADLSPRNDARGMRRFVEEAQITDFQRDRVLGTRQIAQARAAVEPRADSNMVRIDGGNRARRRLSLCGSNVRLVLEGVVRALSRREREVERELRVLSRSARNYTTRLLCARSSSASCRIFAD